MLEDLPRPADGFAEHGLARLADARMAELVRGVPPSGPGPGKRRPRPPGMHGRGEAAQAQTEREPLSRSARHAVQPAATTASPDKRTSRPKSRGASASPAIGAPAAPPEGEREVARLRRTIADFEVRFERQAQELRQLRRQLSDGAAGSPPRRPASGPPSGVEQSTQTQTEENRFAEQLDALHRESGQKSRELRRALESVRTLQAELRQEKLLANQYKATVEGLEELSREATRKQQLAEEQRMKADWLLRNEIDSGGRSSRATSRPTSARVMKAWAEGDAASRSSSRPDSRHSASRPGASIANGRPPRLSAGSQGSLAGSAAEDEHRRRPVEAPDLQRGLRVASQYLHDESPSDSDVPNDDAASASSSGDDLDVFHPPPVGPDRYAGNRQLLA